MTARRGALENYHIFTVEQSGSSTETRRNFYNVATGNDTEGRLRKIAACDGADNIFGLRRHEPRHVAIRIIHFATAVLPRMAIGQWIF